VGVVASLYQSNMLKRITYVLDICVICVVSVICAVSVCRIIICVICVGYMGYMCYEVSHKFVFYFDHCYKK